MKTGFLAVIGAHDGNSLVKFRQALALGSINGSDATVIMSWRQIAKEFAFDHRLQSANEYLNRWCGEGVNRVLNPAVQVLMGYNMDYQAYQNWAGLAQGTEQLLGVNDDFFVNMATNQVHFKTESVDKPLWFVYTNNKQIWVTSDFALLEYVLKRHDKFTQRIKINMVKRAVVNMLHVIDLWPILVSSERLEIKFTKSIYAQMPEEQLELVLSMPADAESAKRLESIAKPDLDKMSLASPMRAENLSFTREEIREMEPGRPDAAVDHTKASLSRTQDKLREQFIRIGRLNWADQVTWSQKTKDYATQVHNKIDEFRDYQANLTKYLTAFMAEVDVRRLRKEMSSNTFFKNKFKFLPPVGQQRQAQVA